MDELILTVVGPLQSVFAALLAVATGCIAIAFYRIYLHPLSHVPGPKVAAATSLYEFYYDGCLGGRYYWEIMRMHEQHGKEIATLLIAGQIDTYFTGPVVRISPNAVHINDPVFFDQLYNVTNRLDKDPIFYRMLGLPQSTFQTTSHDLHRARRKPISKFFTSAAVVKGEVIINRNLDKLAARLEPYRESDRPVNLSVALRCLTTDNISEYVLPHGPDLLSRYEFAASYNRQVRDLGIVSLWNRTFPFLLPLSMMTPRWIVKYLAPAGALETFDVQMGIAKQANDIATSAERSERTVVHGIMNSDLPAEEKQPRRVMQDAWGVVLAGTETTATALEHILFHVLSNDSVLRRIRDELRAFVAAGGDLRNGSALRRLPYLNAVVSEGLRLASPVSGRLPRVDRNLPFTCNGVTLPPGTSIAMSISAMHSNANVYPNPTRFDPDRFLRSSDGRRAEAYLVPFGKGSRRCLGQDFALTSMALISVFLLNRFHMKLHDTSIRDIDMAHEMFAPFSAADAKGVRVILR
jgi:cytochrome P450